MYAITGKHNDRKFIIPFASIAGSGYAPDEGTLDRVGAHAEDLVETTISDEDWRAMFDWDKVVHIGPYVGQYYE